MYRVVVKIKLSTGLGKELIVTTQCWVFGLFPASV